MEEHQRAVGAFPQESTGELMRMHVVLFRMAVLASG